MSSSGDAIGECNEIVNVLRQSVNGCSLARDPSKDVSSSKRVVAVFSEKVLNFCHIQLK